MCSVKTPVSPLRRFPAAGWTVQRNAGTEIDAERKILKDADLHIALGMEAEAFCDAAHIDGLSHHGQA